MIQDLTPPFILQWRAAVGVQDATRARGHPPATRCNRTTFPAARPARRLPPSLLLSVESGKASTMLPLWLDVALRLGLVLAAAILALATLSWLAGVRYIPHHKLGVVERLWSFRGSLKDGRIVALDGEAGFQAEILRGGVHLG
jgi:hypothetical protein